MYRLTTVLLLCLLALGCTKSSSKPAAKPLGHVKLIPAPVTALDGAAAAIAEQKKATEAGNRHLLVFVSATWCEPCQRFHHAAESGQLDADFGDVDLMTFDATADSERLATAGYFSNLIPLLAVPGPDGRATGKQMEGSVKGEGAVAQMTPRLKELLGR